MEVVTVSKERSISSKRSALKPVNHASQKSSKHHGAQSYETRFEKARQQASLMARTRTRCTKSELLHCSGWPESRLPNQEVKKEQSKAFERETKFPYLGCSAEGLEEVNHLQKNLRREINLRKALERAFNRPIGSLPHVPHDLPSETQELIAEVAVLEEEIVTLEDRFSALQQDLYSEAVYVSALQKQKHNSLVPNALSIQGARSYDSKKKPSSPANVPQKSDFAVTKFLSSKKVTHSKETSTLLRTRGPSSNTQKQHVSENNNVQLVWGANEPVKPSLGRKDKSENPSIAAFDMKLLPHSCQTSAGRQADGYRENNNLQETTEMDKLNTGPKGFEIQGKAATRNTGKEDLRQSRMVRSSLTAENGGKIQSEKLIESLSRCRISSFHVEPENRILNTKELPSTLASRRFSSSCISLCDIKSEPNKLSEETLKCLLSIYLTVTRPYIVSDSDSLSSLSLSTFSSFGSQSYGSKSSGCIKFMVGVSEQSNIHDPYGVCHIVPHDIGPYKQLQEITAATFDYGRIAECTSDLKKLRDMVEKLTSVDVHGMSHRQKLAFWINIHNACMMHAFLEHGIPCSSHQATLNVGGYFLNAQTIEHMLRLSSHSNNKSIKISKETAQISSTLGLEWPEPQVIFALCSGARSSPAVRIYTAAKIDHELEVAKKDYLQAAISFTSKQKVLIPRLLYRNISMFAKDAESLLDWVGQQLPKSLQINVKEYLEKANGAVSQVLEVMPYDFSFCYLLC